MTTIESKERQFVESCLNITRLMISYSKSLQGMINGFIIPWNDATRILLWRNSSSQDTRSESLWILGLWRHDSDWHTTSWSHSNLWSLLPKSEEEEEEREEEDDLFVFVPTNMSTASTFNLTTQGHTQACKPTNRKTWVKYSSSFTLYPGSCNILLSFVRLS